MITIYIFSSGSNFLRSIDDIYRVQIGSALQITVAKKTILKEEKCGKFQGARNTFTKKNISDAKLSIRT